MKFNAKGIWDCPLSQLTTPRADTTARGFRKPSLMNIKTTSQLLQMAHIAIQSKMLMILGVYNYTEYSNKLLTEKLSRSSPFPASVNAMLIPRKRYDGKKNKRKQQTAMQTLGLGREFWGGQVNSNHQMIPRKQKGLMKTRRWRLTDATVICSPIMK